MITTCTSHIIRNQQGHCLIDAITPCRGIVEVKPFRLVFFIGHFLKVGMSASHGLFSILHVGKNIGTTNAHTHTERSKKHNGGYTKMFPSLLLPCFCQLCKKQHPNEHTDVVRHLRVNEEAHRNEKHSQKSTKSILSPVNKQETYQHKRHPCDSHSLTSMLSGYDDKEITRHCRSKSPGHAHPFINLKRAQKQKEGNQVEKEDEHSIARTILQHFIKRQQYLSRQISSPTYLIVWHTGKHRSVPPCTLAGGLTKLH